MAMEKRYKDYCGKIVEYINSLPLPSDECHDEDRIITDIIGYVERQVKLYGIDLCKYIPVLTKQVGDGMSLWARGIVDEDMLCNALANLVGVTDDSREQQPKEKSLADLLPEWLRTDEAMGVFQRAIDSGLMHQTSTGFQWHRTKALLAYLMGHFLVNGVFPDTAYSNLFGVQRLGQAFYNISENTHGDGKPRGHEEIDKLF